MLSNSTIQLGDKVTIKFRNVLDEEVFQVLCIVSPTEHNSSQGFEGNAWARKLMGKKVGDEVILPCPEENELRAIVVEVSH